jgi:hypothetical protein
MNNILQGIKSLLFWLPVIWNDRHWDHYFLYKILHHKLLGIEKTSKNSLHLHWGREIQRIKVCISLLNRLLEDEYFENAEKNPYNWGYKRIFEHEERQIVQDVDMLFTYMKKYIRTWWW